MYTNATSKIMLEQEGDGFQVERGVRQGDTISPKLFNAVLQLVFNKIDFKAKGININGRKLNHLRFADDIALFSETIEELQEMINILNDAGRPLGLKINVSKTKIMSSEPEEDPVNINDEEVEYVEEFIYLGQIISFRNRQDKEISRRILNAWKGFWKLKDFLVTKRFPMHLKTKIFNMCILPILSYGSETWSLTNKNKKRLSTTQHSMERRVLGIRLKDKVRIETIREKTEFIDIIQFTGTRKWKWAGHVIRREDQRWTTETTNWRPRDGKRNRGRQFTRWRDELGKGWERLARDRAEWRRIARGPFPRKDE